MVYLVTLLVVFIFVNSDLVRLDAQAKRIANVVLLVLFVLCLLLFLPLWPWRGPP
jgi:hypothetical protein